jgi:hypothetical protein
LISDRNTFGIFADGTTGGSFNFSVTRVVAIVNGTGIRSSRATNSVGVAS